MKHLLIAVMGLMTLIPAAGLAQVPDGNDISTAIPIYFGQTINDVIDGKTRPIQWYTVSLSKGQQVSFRAKTANGSTSWNICLRTPNAKVTDGCAAFSGAQSGYSGGGTNPSIDYQVATSGVYIFDVFTWDPGVSYQFQMTATGTPIATPNPTSAGCLTGQVDYITYSLQLIAASLPDEASIGGTKLCPSCSVKPPAYPQLVNKLETAMGLNVGVQACYDATGNIFQLKMNHP